MAKNASLAQVRTLARLYADSGRGSGTPTITNSEANLLINQSLGEFYDLLVSARGHEHYLSEQTISTVAGTATYGTNAYQVLSVAINWGTNRLEEVPALNSVNERSEVLNWGTWGESNHKAFRVRGAQIELFPTPTAVVSVVVRHIPPFTTLVADGDTFDGVNGWEKLIALKVAIEMRTIEGLPATFLTRLYEQERERIEELASQLAANHPVQIRDVDPERNGVDPWLRLPRATL